MGKSKIIIREGEKIDYQTMIEETVGDFLAENMNYISTNESGFFIGDADYELKIIKKL